MTRQPTRLDIAPLEAPDQAGGVALRTSSTPVPLPAATNLAAGALAPNAAREAAAESAVPLKPRPGLGQMFSSLRHRNFRLFWTGQLVSLVGTWMQMIARSWLVYKLAAGTGNQGLWLGAVALASSVPVLLFSLHAGVITDRVSKWRIVVATQTSAMILAFVLGALTLTGIVQIWHVIAISLILGVVNAFDAPARQAFTVDMVGKEDLLNAVALNSTVFNAARVLGPAVAGVVLGLVGPGLCFVLNGASYIAVIIGLLMMRLPKFVARPQTESSWARLKEGLSYIRTNEICLALMVLVGINGFFGMSYSTLAPIFADHVLAVGEQGYGLLMAAAGIGALIGALNLTVQSGRGVQRGRLIITGSLLFSLFLCLFGLSTIFPLSLVLLGAVGWSMISQNATTNTVIQTTTPDHLRGRVMSVYALLFLGIAPMGSMLAGFMADLWGAQIAIIINGLICGIASLAVWRWRPRLTQIQ